MLHESVGDGAGTKMVQTHKPGDAKINLQKILDTTLDFEIESGDGFWIAARASGEYGTWAHTTPVYVVRRGLRFWKYGAVDDLVTKRLGSLREIEQRVGEARQLEDSDKVPRQSPALQQLVAQGPALLQRVEEARQIYEELLETARREAPVRAR